MESRAEHDAEEDVIAEENVGDDKKTTKEDDDTTGKDLYATTNVDSNMSAYGRTGDKPDVTVTKGETPVKITEGGTPIFGTKGETPVLDNEGETPEDVVEGETPVIAEEPISGGFQTIVDLVNEPDVEDSPATARMEKRKTRQRSILDEVDEPTRPSELDFGGHRPRAGGNVPEESEAEEQRLAIERKRKGKQEAKILPKKPKKNPAAESTTKMMADGIKVPFAKALENPATDSEVEEESQDEEEPNFERAEIWITKKLLESMESFDDPKRAQTYRE